MLTILRKRDNSNISYQYDGLDRLIQKNVPPIGHRRGGLHHRLPPRRPRPASQAMVMRFK